MMVIGGSAAQPTKAAQSAESIYSVIVGVLRYWPSWVVTATELAELGGDCHRNLVVDIGCCTKPDMVQMVGSD